MGREDIMLAIAVLIKNATVLICFTFLAIVFQKWWIVFFSIIFWSSVSTKNGGDN